MPESYVDRLMDKIRNEVWLGKELLIIPDIILSAVNTSQEWFMNLPHIKFLMEQTPLGTLKNLISNAQNLSGVVRDTALIFFETNFGITKALNSKVYNTNLAGNGQSILSKLSLTSNEINIYNQAIAAHNDTLNLPILNAEMQGLEAQIRQIQTMGQSSLESLRQFEEQGKQKLRDLKNQLEQLVSSLAGKENANERAKVRRRLNQVEANLKKLEGSPGVVPGNNSFSATAIVPVIPGTPTIAGAAKVIGAIASWLLGSYLLKAVVDFPAQMLGALTQTVTSVVLKYLGGSGAEAIRFLAASVLKAGKAFLPELWTGTVFAGGWAWLMAHAGYIIIAAVIIILAIQEKNTLGEFLYVFAHTDSEGINFNLGQAHLYDTNRQEMASELQKLAVELVSYSRGRSYNRIIGVATTEKHEPVMCWDLTNTSQPIPITDKNEIKTLIGNKFSTLKTGAFFT